MLRYLYLIRLYSLLIVPLSAAKLFLPFTHHIYGSSHPSYLWQLSPTISPLAAFTHHISGNFYPPYLLWQLSPPYLLWQISPTISPLAAFTHHISGSFHPPYLWQISPTISLAAFTHHISGNFHPPYLWQLSPTISLAASIQHISGSFQLCIFRVNQTKSSTTFLWLSTDDSQ